MNEKAKYYIDKLKLIPHPEGGYFKEVYRSEEMYNAEHLPERYKGNRSFGTSIYFLLEGTQVSTFHKLKSDEIWHFYEGSAVRIYNLNTDNNVKEIILGNNLDQNEILQAVIPKNSWFGAEVTDKSDYALVGCSVAPGFDFSDFELGKRDELLKKFPSQSNLIMKLTHQE